jgi:hypothetical protein
MSRQVSPPPYLRRHHQVSPALSPVTSPQAVRRLIPHCSQRASHRSSQWASPHPSPADNPRRTRPPCQVPSPRRTPHHNQALNPADSHPRPQALSHLRIRAVNRVCIRPQRLQRNPVSVPQHNRPDSQVAHRRRSPQWNQQVNRVDSHLALLRHSHLASRPDSPPASRHSNQQSSRQANPHANRRVSPQRSLAVNRVVSHLRRHQHNPQESQASSPRLSPVASHQCCRH